MTRNSTQARVSREVRVSQLSTLARRVAGDVLIAIACVRSLTALSNDIAGVSTYADGVVRLSTAAFVEAD